MTSHSRAPSGRDGGDASPSSSQGSRPGLNPSALWAWRSRYRSSAVSYTSPIIRRQLSLVSHPRSLYPPRAKSFSANHPVAPFFGPTGLRIQPRARALGGDAHPTAAWRSEGARERPRRLHIPQGSPLNHPAAPFCGPTGLWIQPWARALGGDAHPTASAWRSEGARERPRRLHIP
ncbi:hypothetical protein EI77_04664 [Prosthecobacter fusiformis]|uniref:Uncharacterized protein n=1 Tax=Prosthecobacter fusiformis TaxID=48464 RepID=A0A4R7RJE1_9BACT|nr:hypothetical protein EI77_04664 [Prosthecobacter fusiformis]